VRVRDECATYHITDVTRSPLWELVGGVVGVPVGARAGAVGAAQVAVLVWWIIHSTARHGLDPRRSAETLLPTYDVNVESVLAVELQASHLSHHAHALHQANPSQRVSNYPRAPCRAWDKATSGTSASSVSHTVPEQLPLQFDVGSRTDTAYEASVWLSDDARITSA
jgi:hypothetical protein